MAESSDDEPLSKKIRTERDSSDDEVPLAMMQLWEKQEDIYSEPDDSDKDSDFVGQCEYKQCTEEIWKSCEYCEQFFCIFHLENHRPCFYCKKKKKSVTCGEEKILKKKANKNKNYVNTTKTQVKGNQINEDQPAHQGTETHPGNQHCEVPECTKEVFSSCHRCLILLCWDHFEQNNNCDIHTVIPREHCTEIGYQLEHDIAPKRPEDFTIDGGDDRHRPKKSPRKNQKSIAKALKNKGKQYQSPRTKKTVPEKQLKDRCLVENCHKWGKECDKIDDEARLKILLNYYDLGNIQLQREFLARHLEYSDKKTGKENSRRQKTIKYYLTSNGVKFNVCKRMFMSTLDITDRITRTVLAKVNETGQVVKDQRGGRQSKTIEEKEIKIRNLIHQHIDRFPHVESHYCRASSSRDYLHPDLSLPKMYDLFMKEHKHHLKEDFPSLSTYRRVFSTKNLSFHRPKKDQCSLCMTFKTGDDSVKQNLRDQYEYHTKQKEKVRGIKDQCKKESQQDNTKVTASFDLQQVIHLPITKESALFYKRRLAVYNLTVYNIGNKEVMCFTWDETQSKRGSSEISTAMYKALELFDAKGAKTVNLFADGCPGQNKNSILPAMLLYAISKSSNIEEINLRFFEAYHGQNEGDSCHSAISYALKQAGDVFIPSELNPIFRLARKDNPYSVYQLQFTDFLDFKGLSKDLRILKERDVHGDPDAVVDWTKMVELRICKKNLQQIDFKTSHLENSYKTIHLKRQKKHVKDMVVRTLNKTRPLLPKAKYMDLTSLCTGNTPVIRLDEHKMFYRLLPHTMTE